MLIMLSLREIKNNNNKKTPVPVLRESALLLEKYDM